MIKILTLLFLLLLLHSSLNASKRYTPDNYTKKGYCIVTSHLLKHKGLISFNSKEEFRNKCSGKMIFKYKSYKCRWFTMKKMKFNIFIGNGKTKELFKIGQRKEICSIQVIEEL